MREVHCVRCGQTAKALEVAPFESPLGARIAAAVCAGCWGAWQDIMERIVNEYRLSLGNAEHEKALLKQLRLFLNLPEPDEPTD